VLQTILNTADITRNDTVLEIGPGLGVLTRDLASRAGQLFTVELDASLAKMLCHSLGQTENVTVVNDDILKINPAKLIGGGAGYSPNYKVVANLPYYITSAVLRHLLEASLRPGVIIVMVQKEVAQVISAAPGDMSLLSVSVQFYGKPEIISDVPAGAFLPPPEVDSAILKITVYPEPAVSVPNKAAFFNLVRAGFSTARKQLANSLSRGLGIPKAEAISLLERARIDRTRRAETLTLKEWAELLQALNTPRGGG